MNIWLTRPRDDSKSLAAELAAHGIASVVAPVLHIVHQPLESVPVRPDALLLTSRHAAHALAALPTQWRALPTFCVGAATSAAASAVGFTNITPGEGKVLNLLPRMAVQLPPESRVLYLAGEETRINIPALLVAQRIYIRTQVVYRAIANHTLDDAVREALTAGSLTSVAFFSPRSAQVTASILATAGLSDAARMIDAYCLSADVANAANALPFKAIHTCPRPTRVAMVDLIISHTTKTV